MKRQLYNHKRSLLAALCCIGLFCALSSTAWAQADLWIRDNVGDTGAEPNTTTGAFYASPDIWITYTSAPTPQEPYPLSGSLNWVHVTVRNRGNAYSSGTEKLHLYFTSASTGLSWPSTWINCPPIPGCTATVFGDEIGSATIPSLAPGGTVDMVIQWWAPDIADYACLSDPGHFCMLARIVPGMTYAETSIINDNTRNNNNIAWRNYSYLKLPCDGDSETATVLVRNVRDAATAMRLRVAIPDNDDGNIFENANVAMVLDGELFQKWQANGAQGENIENQGDGTIHLMNVDAWIGGIPMDPGETHEVGLAFARANDNFTGVAEIDMIQEDNGEFTGGERFGADFAQEDCVDLWMKDDANDTGVEPNPGGASCSSPDIWISNTMGGPPQQPVAGALNWVHVRVRNRGTMTSSGTEVVHLYWSKASMGLSWSTQWVNYYSTLPGCPSILFGDEIGNATIPALAPMTSTVIYMPWYAPDYTNYSCVQDKDHVCLLGRIEPGMTYTETSSIPYNTHYNNNVVWKNVYLIHLPPGTNNPVKGLVLARNVKAVATTMKFRFAIPENADDNVFEHATINAVLAQELYNKWQANGAQGENIEDMGDGTIRLLNADAWIDGMPMDPDETYEAGLEFTRADDDYTGIGAIDMIQEDDGEMTGAERFTVYFSDEADGIISGLSDRTVPVDGISVYPNPAQTEFTISNTDKSISYSVRMLDVLGREVYSTTFSGELKISVAKFSKGTYYIELKNAQNGTQTTKQIVVE